MTKSHERIDENIFQAIWNKVKKTKPNVTERAIYMRIEAIRRSFNNTISPRMAANLLAAEMGVDVYRILRDESELKELRGLLKRETSQSGEQAKGGLKKEKDQPITINRRVVDTFRLPPDLATEAQRMADVYPTMYVFENTVRHVVMTVLKEKYGENWWHQPDVVSNEIKRSVQSRKQSDRQNRWHSKRGSHEIFYTDFNDLTRIIATNINEFRSVFGGLDIQAEMKQLEPSRNIIAHNNPLPQREIQRIELYSGDLRKQLHLYTAKQE